jgi:nuclear pore complex protein Nup98-Nup96
VFGQPAQQQTQENKPGGFGAFGLPQSTTGTTPFGQTTQGTTGAFGQPAQQATGTFGAFGPQNQQQQQQQQPAGGGPGAFGSAFGANKPAGTGPFGSFGQPSQQQPQSNTAGFGNFGSTGTSTTNAPSSTPGTGFGPFGSGPAFGVQQQPGQQAGTGSTTNSSPFGAFGSAFNKPATTLGTGFGSFGQSGGAANAQPQQQQPSGASPFGGIFGASNQQQQGQQQQPVAGVPTFGGGLFSQANKSTLGGIGTSPASGTGGFGASTVFGARPTSLFGQPAQHSTGPNAASIDANNIYGSNSLVSQALNNASLLHLKDDDNKKGTTPVSNFSYTMRHVPRASPTISRLRGFTNPLQDVGSSGTGGNLSAPIFRASSVGPSESASNAFSPRPAFGGSLSESLAASISRQNSPGISPDAFRPRTSVKKLTMPLRVDAESVRDGGRSASVPPSLSGISGGAGSKVHWSATAEHALNESQSIAATGRASASTSARRDSTPTPARQPAAPVATAGASGVSTDKCKEGDYWTRPSISELKKRSFADLSHLEDFTVGRVGYGEITFLEPVDLTSLNAIADIPGGVIEFDDRSCVVYVDETLKPPPGEGLNVPSRISLEKCWATDRATREYIKDSEHPRHRKHMRTLQNKENTKFVSFDTETGIWVFEVPHFTRYGLDESDDEDDDETYNPPTARPPATVTDPAGASPVGDADQSRTQSPSDAAQQPRPPTPEENSIEVDPGSEHSETSEVEEELVGEPEDLSLRLWSSRVDLDPRRVNVMQASLFAQAHEEDDGFDERHSPFAATPRRSSQPSFQPRFGQDVSMKSAPTGVSISLYIV